MLAKRHLFVLSFIVAGVVLEMFAFDHATNGMLRGAGALLFMIGLVVEIIGIAIYGES